MRRSQARARGGRRVKDRRKKYEKASRKAGGRLQHAVTPPSPASPNLASSTTDARVGRKASAPPVPIPQGNISSSCLVAHLRPRCSKPWQECTGWCSRGPANPACSSRRSTGYVVAATRTTAPSGCSRQIVPHHHVAR
ncbi:hypothetical protein BN1723_011525 [Verticillium longisporum]|uniref:Uncharacterized protein n=1 Tax=Verticillium longisporum TaxID=100787 RepID=A0A0G4L845_VERLO|nr:hypothetical protein BN1723_011525 [Verticillium longisporum]CRK43090.1 hypothetical protein BN1708_008949 [Verticillium longisporum]